MLRADESEDQIFGEKIDASAPSAAAAAAAEIACLNDSSTDLTIQAMKAEREAMVAAGLVPASLTDLEASHLFLHVNGMPGETANQSNLHRYV